MPRARGSIPGRVQAKSILVTASSESGPLEFSPLSNRVRAKILDVLSFMRLLHKGWETADMSLRRKHSNRQLSSEGNAFPRPAESPLRAAHNCRRQSRLRHA